MQKDDSFINSGGVSEKGDLKKAISERSCMNSKCLSNVVDKF